MRDVEWKNTRKKLSPALTASKLKTMFPIIKCASEKMIEFICTKIDEEIHPMSGITFDAKDVSVIVVFRVK